MSYHVFFDFSTGLSKSIRVPKGTKARIAAHVQHLEATLMLQTEQYLDNPPHWTRESKRCEDIEDGVLCREVEQHNDFVRRLYHLFAEGHKGPGGEKLTPAEARTFWHALERLSVPPERWTADYYRDRMEHLFRVMLADKDEEDEGVSLDAPALTVEQAEAVVNLFGEYLDNHDLRLAVPWGHDRLMDSDEYVWCEHCCRAIYEDDLSYNRDDIAKCPKCRRLLY